MNKLQTKHVEEWSCIESVELCVCVCVCTGISFVSVSFFNERNDLVCVWGGVHEIYMDKSSVSVAASYIYPMIGRMQYIIITPILSA